MNFLSRIILFCLVAAALLAISTKSIKVAEAAETIVIAADNWCPYNCDPQKSDRPGFMLEIAKKAFAKHNINVEYTVLPWTEAISQTRTGKYGAIVGAAYSDAPDFIFPDVPQGFVQNVFYVKKGDVWRFKDVDSLKEILLAVIADYAYNTLLNGYIEEQKNNKFRIKIATGDDPLGDNISKLIEGRVGAVVDAQAVMDYYVSKNNLVGQLEEAGRLTPSQQDNIYIAFAPHNPKSASYAKILSDEMKAMRASGELAKILSAYSLKDWQK